MKRIGSSQIHAFSSVLVMAALAIAVFPAVSQSADFENGAEMFRQHCAACHSHIARVWDKSGPNLTGLFGRRAGSADYIHGYSAAMANSGLTWDLGTLMAFITSPAGVVRGTNMVFRGLEDPTQRADLLCYLRQATDPNRTRMPGDCDDF